MRIVAGALSAALIICTSLGPARAQSAQDLTPEGRGAYVAVAGANDLYEVRAGALALERARRPEVRQFAQEMVSEHRGSAERLLAAARTLGMDALPPAMMPMHWDMLRRLERSSRSRFDRVYIDQEVESHEIAVELHRNYAASGDAARLKAFAQAALPTAARHLERARQLDQ